MIGLFAGFGVLLLIDEIVPHLHFKTGEVEGVKSGLKRYDVDAGDDDS